MPYTFYEWIRSFLTSVKWGMSDVLFVIFIYVLTSILFAVYLNEFSLAFTAKSYILFDPFLPASIYKGEGTSEGVTGKCLIFRTFQHCSLNISLRFHSIEKWLHWVRVIGAVNVWKFLDHCWNVWKEEGVFGEMLKIMELRKSWIWKWLKIKILSDEGQKATITRCPWPR